MNKGGAGREGLQYSGYLHLEIRGNTWTKITPEGKKGYPLQKRAHSLLSKDLLEVLLC